MKKFAFCEVKVYNKYRGEIKMRLIKREYLTKLIDVKNTPDIKVITGVRRSGKSKLLEMFKEYIVKNVDNNIIH